MVNFRSLLDWIMTTTGKALLLNVSVKMFLDVSMGHCHVS